MKKKDIAIVSICLLVIVSSVYFIFTGFSGKKGSSNQNTQVKETMDFTGNIDDAAIQKIKQRKDYGSVPMDGIGRENPFANF